MNALPIVSPADYVPRTAISFGTTRAEAVDHAHPLPVQVMAAPSFQDRLLCEGWQATNTYARGDNAARAFAVGDTLGNIAASPGRALSLVPTIVSTTRKFMMCVQRTRAVSYHSGS